MEENGTYRWPPQGSPKPPKKKPNFDKLGRSITIIAVLLVLLSAVGYASIIKAHGICTR